MKKLLASLTMIVSLFLQYSKAQVNLVPNPSFEDTVACPQAYPNLDGYCSEWVSFRVTPDYFHNCSSVCGYYNQAGYQAPNSGLAYAGFATYQITDSTAREHLGAQLVNPLSIGTKYYISFFVSPAWNGSLANIATNKIGCKFSTNYYFDSNGSEPLSNEATFYTDSVLSDTINWIQLFGEFIADSNYSFIILGNFFDNQYVDTILLPFQVVSQAAYYYIDDVCVSTDSSFARNWTSTNNTNPCSQFSVFPNPTFSSTSIYSCDPITQITILNSLGQFVDQISYPSLQQVDLSLISRPAGVYFIFVTTTSKEIRYKLTLLQNR